MIITIVVYLSWNIQYLLQYHKHLSLSLKIKRCKFLRFWKKRSTVFTFRFRKSKNLDTARFWVLEYQLFSQAYIIHFPYLVFYLSPFFISSANFNQKWHLTLKSANSISYKLKCGNMAYSMLPLKIWYCAVT